MMKLSSLPIRSVLAACFLAVSMAFAPADAQALSLQDIIVMMQQGVSDDVIITVINGANDLPAMTKEDYQTLNQAGVSMKVAAAVAKRRKVLETSGDAMAVPAPVAPVVPEPVAPASVAPATPAPVAPASPAPVVPEPVVPAPVVPASSNTGLVPILPEGENVILAPIESSNVPLVFRKFFEEAYEVYSVESEVARRYARLQSATASERAYDSEVPKVIGYRRQIDTQPISALESCLTLAEQSQAPLDTPLGAALNQCIGLALQKLNAPAMAAAYLDQALQSKAQLQDFTPTLEAFLVTAHASDYTSTAPLKIKEHAELVTDAGRHAYLYFIGYSLVYGPQPDPVLAKQLLSNVPKGTIYYPRARILLATLAVRAPEYKFKTAAEYLNEAIEALSGFEDDNTAFELKNTAWLALARIAFENHAYDVADTFYRRVDIRSHHLRDALLEDAWGQLFAQNHANALALTHALRAPIFKKAWLPDLLLLEAGAYLGLCRYEMADHALEALRNTVLADASSLKEYLAQTPSRDYYNQVIRHAENPEKSALPASIYYRVINDNTFRAVHRSIRLLSQERAALSQHAGPAFTSLPQLQAVYDNAIAQRQQFMATLLAGIYDKAASELHALDISASQVAIEIRLAQRQREAACLKIVASGGQCETPQSVSDQVTFQKRDTDAFWTFDGEFWRDEIRAYVSGVSSLCVVPQAE